MIYHYYTIMVFAAILALSFSFDVICFHYVIGTCFQRECCGIGFASCRQAQLGFRYLERQNNGQSSLWTVFDTGAAIPAGALVAQVCFAVFSP